MAIWLWIGFIAFVLVMLALDLGVFQRKAHVIRPREALGWTGLCVALALAFNVAVYFIYQHNWLGVAEVGNERLSGYDAAAQFFAGWVLEYSLSLDNIFVIAVIFQYFRIPTEHQHRVLIWGILGALIMRGVMIGLGAALIHNFSWVNYAFGALLIYTAIKLLRTQEEDPHPEGNPLVRLARRFYPVSPNLDGQRFFTLIDGRRTMTPMFIALLVVETTDVLFAIDSIPAVFAVTQAPFIVFTSNVFAILGLRSLYFALAAAIGQFRYLKTSLGFVLAYVGVKMLLSKHYEIPIGVTLAIIGAILFVGIGASVLASRRDRR